MLEFHLSQCIHLPVFCPIPHASYTDRVLHSLDIHCALAFNLHRTRPFHTWPKLFVAIAVQSKGQALSPSDSPDGSLGSSLTATYYPTYCHSALCMRKQLYQPASRTSPGKTSVMQQPGAPSTHSRPAMLLPKQQLQTHMCTHVWNAHRGHSYS